MSKWLYASLKRSRATVNCVDSAYICFVYIYMFLNFIYMYVSECMCICHQALDRLG